MHSKYDIIRNIVQNNRTNNESQYMIYFEVNLHWKMSSLAKNIICTCNYYFLSRYVKIQPYDLNIKKSSNEKIFIMIIWILRIHVAKTIDYKNKANEPEWQNMFWHLEGLIK